MARLIDLDKIKPIDFPSVEMDGLDVVRYLNTLPTVDAVEMVHGRWVHVTSSDMMTGKAYICSECKKMRYGLFMPNYCPNCGAKMDGVADG